MPRPLKKKKVWFDPTVTYYKPQGVPLQELEEVVLTGEELEALRLTVEEELSQTQAAQSMGVHQSTLQRTLARAEKKVVHALITGKAIRIQNM